MNQINSSRASRAGTPPSLLRFWLWFGLLLWLGGSLIDPVENTVVATS
jgi:hypothetical protein